LGEAKVTLNPAALKTSYGCATSPRYHLRKARHRRGKSGLAHWKKAMPGQAGRIKNAGGGITRPARFSNIRRNSTRVQIVVRTNPVCSSSSPNLSFDVRTIRTDLGAAAILVIW
jgi:hypothetical protein